MNQFDIKEIFINNIKDNTTLNIALALVEEWSEYKSILDKIKEDNQRIIDYGFDYDGFNNVEDLKKLIDMLVDYARKNNELLEEIE